MDIKYLIKEAKYYGRVTGLSRATKKFLLTQTPFSNIVNGKIYRKYYSRTIKRKIKKTEPWILQIENTNICNAKCIMCPHVFMKRKQKIMNQKDFEKIVDNVMKSYKIKRLVLNGFGEPFIDKGVIEKIKYVNKKHPLVKIEIYTNGSLIDKETADNLLKTELDRITFSVNGTNKNYKKIMGLDYDKTMKNILYFLSNNKTASFSRKTLGRKKRILTNISLMVLDDNKNDVDKFIKFWSKLTDSVRAYLPNDWAGGVNNIIYNTPFKIDKRWPCFYLWNNITVDVEGNLIMCCRDYESRVIFGSLLRQNLKEIRDSKKFIELQKNHLKHDFASPVCNACDIRFESSLDWIC